MASLASMASLSSGQIKTSGQDRRFISKLLTCNFEMDFVLLLYAIVLKYTCSFQAFFSFQASDAVISSIGQLDSELMWPVPKPRASARSLCRFLSEKTRQLHIFPFPGVQIGTNKSLGKPVNMDEYQISRRESSFYPLLLFPFLSRNTDLRRLWERAAPNV